MSTPQHARTSGSNRKKKTSSPETREANREFLRRHPERGGRLLDPSNPNDREALAEWRQIYAEAKARNQPPAPKPAPSKPVLPCQVVKQECELKSAEVACSHVPSKRKYKIALPNTDPKKRYICVIAGREKTEESIQVKTVLAKPLCNKDKTHAKRHIIVKPPFNAAEIVSGAQQYKFNVKSSLQIPMALGTIGKIKVLYKYIWPSYETKDVYYIDVDACTTNGPAQAIVRVYPDISWAIEIAVSAGFERKRTSKYAANGEREIENEGGYPIGFELKVGYKYDGLESFIGKEFKTKYIESSAWMRLLKISAKWLRWVAYQAGNVTVTFPQIQFGFKYTSTLAELEDKPDVARDVELELAADPLLGATIEVDLLALLIKAAGTGGAGLGIACAPAIAEWLLKARKAAEEGIDKWGVKAKATFALVLGLKGGITAAGSIKISQGSVAEGKITVGGKIEFTFTGTAQAEGKAWCVTVVAGISIQGTAGFAMGGQIGADGEGPFYGGKAYFSGAKLEFKAFYDVKITRRPPDPTKEKEAPGKTGWIVSWPAWPDEGEFKRHRFF